MSWHENRFNPDPSKVCVACAVCGKSMYFPKCKANLYKTCGEICRKALSKIAKEERSKNCVVCGNKFSPRPIQIKNGGGRFCSVKCRGDGVSWGFKEANVREKAYESCKKNGFVAAQKLRSHQNTIKYMSERILPKEEKKKRISAYVKKYRKLNPDKIKEWSHKRNGLKFGRLPYGWVKKLFSMQGGKCCVCSVELKNKYHLDHIVPLSKNGKHEKYNVQLLCRECNLRKSAKDPIKYMQERGFLL